jgi:hypothetical protein
MSARAFGASSNIPQRCTAKGIGQCPQSTRCRHTLLRYGRFMTATFDMLLKDVCIRLGFCGSVVGAQPMHVDQFLPQSGTLTDADFADAVFKAEGLDPDGLEARKFRPAVRDAFIRHMGGSEIDASLASRMDTEEEVRLDREHVAHLLYECRDGRHPATQEDQAASSAIWRT